MISWHSASNNSNNSLLFSSLTNSHSCNKREEEKDFINKITINNNKQINNNKTKNNEPAGVARSL